MPRPVMVWLEPNLLNIDLSYQRDLPENRNIVLGQWNLMYATPLIVNMRSDGSYWIIDGGRRAFIAKNQTVGEVPCYVHQELTYQQECDIFAMLDRTKIALTRGMSDRAFALSGRTREMIIEQMIRAHGLFLTPENWTNRPSNTIYSLKVFDGLGMDNVRTVLDGYVRMPFECWRGKQMLKVLIRAIAWPCWQQVFTNLDRLDYQEFRARKLNHLSHHRMSRDLAAYLAFQETVQSSASSPLRFV